MDGERELYVRRISLPDGLKEVAVLACFASESVRDGVTTAWYVANEPGDFVVLATAHLERMKGQCEELLARLEKSRPQEVGA
jgi:hypothetical protein